MGGGGNVPLHYMHQQTCRQTDDILTPSVKVAERVNFYVCVFNLRQ